MSDYMDKPTASIIVPVYNSEKYLPATLQCIADQTFKNYELLLIDDGSSDGSGQICDEAAAKDSRIHVIHKKNGGICSARNKGLELAEGEYIYFCDNDDEVFPDLLEDNISLMRRYSADVVRFSRIYRATDNGKVLEESRTELTDAYIPSEQFDENMEIINTLGYGVWAGLYRRAFLEEHHLRFDEQIRFGREDWDFTLRVWMARPSVVVNPKAYYVWLMRKEHSTSARTDLNFVDSTLHVLKELRDLYEQIGYLEKHPGVYGKNVVDHIFWIAEYVNPDRVDMRYKDRIAYIKYAAGHPVMQEPMPDGAEQELRKKYPHLWLFYMLFKKKQYGAVYHLVAWRSRMEQRRRCR